jgi:predicted nuclease of predicted toxin-antitoxin system
VRFVVDAQLPRALADLLQRLGDDVVHVKDLPRGGDTSDRDITRFADAEQRVVVTKDSDFRHTHETGGGPRRLLVVTVGNVRNRVLLALVSDHHDAIVTALAEADFVELGATGLTLHPRPIRGR